MNGAYEFGVAATEAASEHGVPLRLFGGQAIRYVTSAYPPRTYSEQDIDLACTSQHTPAVTGLLTELGCLPDERFNALYGHRQMYFVAPDRTTSMDVVVDRLTMCHELYFADRIERLPVTLDIADLLLSKLQVVKINEKDMKDAIYLMSAYPVRAGDEPGTIGLGRFEQIVGGDWGWWRTVTGNLSTLVETAQDLRALVPAGASQDPFDHSRQLLEHAVAVPKSRRWRLRARLGERLRWYEEPEEVTR